MRKFAPVFALLALAAAALVFAVSAVAGPADDVDGDTRYDSAAAVAAHGGGAPDNCVGVFNDDQLDADSDGIGDACDSDIQVADYLADVAFHFRIQNGDSVEYAANRPGPGCIHVQVIRPSGAVGQDFNSCAFMSGTYEAGSTVAVSQVSLPSGCTGGIDGTRRVVVPARRYTPIDITYHCPLAPSTTTTTTTTSTQPAAPSFAPVKRVVHDRFARAGQAHAHALIVPDGATSADVTVAGATIRGHGTHFHAGSLGAALRFAVIAKRAGKATITVTFR